MTTFDWHEERLRGFRTRPETLSVAALACVSAATGSGGWGIRIRRSRALRAGAVKIPQRGPRTSGPRNPCPGFGGDPRAARLGGWEFRTPL